MRKVVVVGAGLAGLRAAWELARSGHEVTVLERKAAAGGRAGSAPDPETGEPVDTGQHVFMGCYRATRAWFGALGTESLLAFQDRLEVPYRLLGGATRGFRAAPLPPPLHLAVAAMTMAGLGLRERLGLLRLAPDILFAPGARRDQATVAVWEDMRGLPRAVRDYLLDPLAIAAVNEPPSRASALPFLTVLRALAWSRAGSRIGFARAGLADLYVPAAVRAIEAAGGALRTGAWAARLVVRDGRAAGVELAGGETVEGDAVVAAVPPWDLAALLGDGPGSAELARATKGFEASPIVTVHLWWDSTVHPGAFSGLPDGPFQWVFNRTAIVGPGNSGHEQLCVVRSGARELLGRKPDELAELAAGDLRRRLPAARDARVLRARTVWETKATVSLTPGSDSRRPMAATPVRGFVLAGDWTRTGLPATIEGAVVSGESAARVVLSLFQ
ncbi:MAG: hydroxysqualene dehydroxylase HpnE [Candidatus Coatesbacteria bacterium]